MTNTAEIPVPPPLESPKALPEALEGTGATENRSGKAVKPRKLAKQIDWAWSRAISVLFDFKKLFSEIFLGLTSKDRMTRRMSVVFFLGMTAFLFLLHGAWNHVRTIIQENVQKNAGIDRGQHLSEFIKKQAAEAKQKSLLAKMGTFRVELKTTPNDKGVVNGVTLAEIEIVLECDQKATRDYLEENFVQVRDQMTNGFMALEKEELMSREGKKKIKDQILEKLNQWLPEGKVTNLYFSLLILS